MDVWFFLIQLLNGVQYGLLLFLVASGLTLIFGIMGIINLAHGAFYMLGAYLAWWLAGLTGSLVAAVVLSLPLAALVGYVIEALLVRTLYKRDHLDQVLLTYGLILIFNEAQRILWGNDVHGIAMPTAVNWSVRLTETLSYPVYRVILSGICAALAVVMYVVIAKTRFGMWVRAGASNRDMVAALGINVKLLFGVVFAVGAALAGLAGAISTPISSVAPGMGDTVLILCFVVVVIGGVGSVKGAFLGAMLIGLADTFGKVFVPDFASFTVYGVMAAVLLWKPRGLFA
ncbi:branched-chain amino acid ABC transporter permease [Paramagnetospirillum kuznetsovii]|uniref:Branched-chain amino acid ABC transporter permease n=1 Tax=Paramagnetospirillum kuznetsovii TaxID=2053833 RepID=A0A364NWM6_9PROT|nr:branched-chain amino acid ABC transporter permease [Paramagnetospirillum kuznetsovii]RAU21491.1 branched-chain amino acid ABC transporter permease [Paramagnetospirillum kuznetsovii]